MARTAETFAVRVIDHPAPEIQPNLKASTSYQDVLFATCNACDEFLPRCGKGVASRKRVLGEITLQRGFNATLSTRSNTTGWRRLW